MGDLALLLHGGERSLSSWSGCSGVHQNVIKPLHELDFLGPRVPHCIQVLLKNKPQFSPDACNDQGAPAEMHFNKHESSSTRCEPGDKRSTGIKGSLLLQAVDGRLEGDMGKWVWDSVLLFFVQFYTPHLHFGQPPRCFTPINFLLSHLGSLLLLSCLGSSLQFTAPMPPSRSPPRCDPFRVLGHCCQTLSASLAATSAGSNPSHFTEF